jgi:BMFP domain-containing protein YqiC
MQTQNRLFDDIARVASGALSTLGGLRDEAEARVRERLERLANDLELVTREEFEAVREMAAEARAQQERLAERVAALEAQLAAMTGGAAARPARRRGAKAENGTAATD